MTTNILNFNYPIISAVFDGSYNIYIATSYEIYVYTAISNPLGSFVGFDDYNGKIDHVFNNIQAITYSNNTLYVSDLEILPNNKSNLKIYSIPFYSLTATLCNTTDIYIYDFDNKDPRIVVSDYKIKLNNFLVVDNSIFFIKTSILDFYYPSQFEPIKIFMIRETIATCNINGSTKKKIKPITYNNIRYYVYGNIIFFNKTYYLFGLATTYITENAYSNEFDEYYIQYASNNEFKFMCVNQDTLDNVNPDNITLVDTSCNNFIYSTITTTGDIYIYETDNINYYINVYNTVGFIKNVYTNATDIITGLISDTKENTYAIQKNDPYSNIILISSDIGDLYKIDTYNGGNSCLNLYEDSYMFRSFVFFNPVNVEFSFRAYLYPNCTAYFNFFTNCDGGGGACLCLSTSNGRSGITGSNRLNVGNVPVVSTFSIIPNTWHIYKIKIYPPNIVKWSMDNTYQTDTFNLPTFSDKNNFCGFISTNSNLLIDEISIVENTP